MESVFPGRQHGAQATYTFEATRIVSLIWRKPKHSKRISYGNGIEYLHRLYNDLTKKVLK